MGYAPEEDRRHIIVQEVRYYALPADAVYELPPYPRRQRRWEHEVSKACFALAAVSCLIWAALVLWPTPPDVQLEHWKLIGINIDSKEEGRSIIPVVHLNISLDVILKIRNRNFAGVFYDSLSVEILYRGAELGDAKLKGGHIVARGTVEVPAVLNLEATEILENASELIVDVAHRKVPFTMRTRLIGAVDFVALQPHVDVCKSCLQFLDCICTQLGESLCVQFCLLIKIALNVTSVLFPVFRILKDVIHP